MKKYSLSSDTPIIKLSDRPSSNTDLNRCEPYRMLQRYGYSLYDPKPLRIKSLEYTSASLGAAPTSQLLMQMRDIYQCIDPPIYNVIDEDLRCLWANKSQSAP